MSQLAIPSSRVDLLIGYSWTESPLLELRRLKGNAELPVPFTPLKGFERTFLGAIPIEAKNASGNSMDARYQLALCGSAMLQLRQRWASIQQKEYNPDRPPIVISLSVTGHSWFYYVMYLGSPRQSAQGYHAIDSVPRILLGPFSAGSTTSLLSTFYLFQFLQALKEWLVEEWAPEVFEELAGIPLIQPRSLANSSVTNTSSVPTVRNGS